MEAEPTAPSPDSLRLKLLSWNLHGVPGAPEISERLAASAGAILRHAPDLALLQEIWLSHHADQLEEALVPAYRCVRLPDEGWGPRRSGLLAFIRHAADWSLEASEFREFAHSASAWRVWEGDGLGRKGIQHLRIARGRTRLHVLNTHLQAEYSDEYPHQKIRDHQLHELSAWAEEIDRAGQGGEPILAAGDLNTDRLAPLDRHPGPANRERALYSRLLDDWQDLFAESCSNSPCATRFESEHIRAGWIDYILWRRSRDWTIAEFATRLLRNERRDFPYSDHEGLLVDLAIRREPRSSTGALPVALLLLQSEGELSRRAFLARYSTALALIAGEHIARPL